MMHYVRLLCDLTYCKRLIIYKSNTLRADALCVRANTLYIVGT